MVLLVLVAMLITVTQIPWIQNIVFTKFTQRLSETTQFSIQHKNFQLKWFQQATLTGLTIKDLNDSSMVSADRITVVVDPIAIVLNGYITIEKADMQGINVHLMKDRATALNLDTFVQRIKMHRPNDDTTGNAQAPFIIKEAILQNGTFTYHDAAYKNTQGAFDANHIQLTQLAAYVSNVNITTDSIEGSLHHFSGRYMHSPLSITKLRTSFKHCQQGLELSEFELKTTNSHIKNTIQLTYPALKNFSQLIDSTHIKAHFEHSFIDTKELAFFIPYFKQYNTQYIFSGNIVGEINDFEANDLRLGFGKKNSWINGHIQLKGLPDWQKSIFNLNVKNGSIYTADLAPYLHDKAYRTYIDHFNYLNIQGSLVGSISDYIAAGSLHTGLGNVSADMHIKNSPKHHLTTYQGSMVIDDFALGKLLDVQTLQNFSMQGTIDGKGLTLATADLNLEAHVSKLGVHNYEYKNLYTGGKFAKEIFEGNLQVNDPNLEFQLRTYVDLRKGTKSLSLQGVVEKASLKALHITNKSSILSTNLDIAVQGLAIDSIKMDAYLHQANFNTEDHHWHLDTLSLCTDYYNSHRTLQFKSPFLTAQADGDFCYTVLWEHTHKLVQRYTQRYLTNEHQLPMHNENFALAYKVELKDINPLLTFFTEHAYMTPNALVQGNLLQKNQETIFSLRSSTIDSLVMNQSHWIGTQLACVTTMSEYKQERFAEVNFTAEKQVFKQLDIAKNLSLDMLLENNQLHSRCIFEQDSSKNQFSINAKAVFLENMTKVNIRPSTIKILNKLWRIHPKNAIFVEASQVKFQDFQLSNGQQSVRLTGIASSNFDESLCLRFNNFSLNNLNSITGHQLSGNVRGSVSLRSALQDRLVESDLTVHAAHIDDFFIGSLNAQAHWDTVLEKLALAFEVKQYKKKVIDIIGSYTPNQLDDNLTLTANFLNAKLHMASPFVEDFLTQLGGVLNGSFHVGGSLQHPEFSGHGEITDATARINYLNTYYHFDASIGCRHQALDIKQLNLWDENGSQACFHGNIWHKNLTLDLMGNMEMFQVLNTTFQENQNFYGYGSVSGILAITGPINHLKFDANIKTAPGTKVYIIGDKEYDHVQQEEYIQFVSFKNQLKKKKRVMSSGILFNLVLEATPDAHISFILNKKTGDGIQATGSGKLTLHVDEKGMFSINGDYKFSKGSYQISLYSVISNLFKIFPTILEISPESHIIWYGSPYTGMLNIEATYNQSASLAPILLVNKSEIDANPDYKKRYPIQVVLTLQGKLLSPETNFKINFQEYPYDINLQAAVYAFQTKAATDKRYLANQIASLVVLKKFFNENLAKTTQDEVAENNVNEILSSQLSSLSSNIDEHLEVDADINLTNTNEANRLRVSYKFLKGKLRVSQESTISGNENYNPTGDWSAEYMLNQAKNLRAKIYNKHVFNSLYTATKRAERTVSGLSLFYIKSFDTLREIFKRQRKKKQP